MARVTHGKTHKIPGYKLSRQNETGESKALIAARLAIVAGAKTYEDKKTGELFVMCGGQVVHWENADPAKIGKENPK